MREEMARRHVITSALLACALTAAAGTSSARAAGKSGSLAEAYRIISTKQFVDLTHSFSPTTPVWKGFGPAAFSVAADPETGQPYTIDKNGFRAFFYSIVGQYGTHVDPPAHFDPAGLTMDRIPVKQMILPLVVFDITPMLKTDPNHALTVDDIRAWEGLHGRVRKGSFAALRTDMYKDWERNPARFKRASFPAWSLDALKFLYEQRGIVANGHESMATQTSPTI